MNDRVTD